MEKAVQWAQLHTPGASASARSRPRLDTGARHGLLCLVLGLLATGVAGAQGLPWTERSDLSLVGQTLAPTTAERLVQAEVLIVADFDLTPAPGGWWLDVDPWTTLNGWQLDPPLCSSSEPFYGQPTPGRTPPGACTPPPSGNCIRGCSGFLVEDDLIVTAGHCVAAPPPLDPFEARAPYDCSNRYVVFDYADLGPINPGEGVFLTDDQVVQCSQVLVDTAVGPATELPESPLGGGDWALLELAEAPGGRLPLAIERFPQTKVGDQVLLLGHPARMPLKAEISAVGSSSTLPLHALGGNSGSALISLETGKVFSNVTHGGISGWVTIKGSPPNECADPCFECPGAGFGGTDSLFWLQDVPALGLQMIPAPDNTVEYYGPPTSGMDYESWSTTLSASVDSLAVDWELAEGGDPPDPPEFLEVVEGPSSGTLVPGESVDVGVRPADWVVDEAGLAERVVSFFDFTYGTRDPVTHRVHVGVDGFTVFPNDAFDGPDGLGVPHGASRLYSPSNRWLGFQDLTVTASVSEPLPWLELDGGPGPVHVTLPCKYCAAPEVEVDVSTNGAGLDPGTYTGTVTFSTDVCSLPGCEQSYSVYFDHCREVFADAALPVHVIVPPGAIDSRPLAVAPTGGTVVEDVDLIAELAGFGPSQDGAGFTVSLEAPDGTEVLLKNYNDPLQAVYDDDTSPPPAQLLELFNGHTSPGLWTLRIGNDHPDAREDLVFDLNRFEVRLHHLGAPPCVP